jgi:hypothetical protein
MLRSIAASTPSPERRRLLAHHVAHVRDAVERDVPSAYDRERLLALTARALDAASRGPSDQAPPFSDSVAETRTATVAGPLTAARPGPPRSPAG